MGGNITVNKRTVVHAGSQGQLTTVDVCKTPRKCRPQTYTNQAFSKDSANTASSILVNGNPVCNVKSTFSVSTGDEPGSCGGTKSGTIKQKAEFVTCSDNVFFEGKPAVRQFDMMVSNNQNTPPMPLQQPGAGIAPELSQKGTQGIEPTPTGFELTIDVLGSDLSLLRDRVVLIPEDDG